jgi:catechol 2,3-dioxygenase-like lactoylglutathione lyase family enzyme
MRVGELFHVVHVVDDLDAAEDWYDRVFDPTYMFRRHESPIDHRTASLLLIADFAPEPMTPYDNTAGKNGTIGKFKRRFGARFHSLAFYCDSVAEAYERFRTAGVSVYGDGGATLTSAPDRGGIYTHPRETFGMIELMEPRIAGQGGSSVGDVLGDSYDPRLRGDYDPARWENHSLGIVGLSHLTVLTSDPAAAESLYVALLDAEPVDKHQPSWFAGHARAVKVGRSTTVEFAAPRSGSAAASSLERDGAFVWSAAFAVRDLDRARTHLREMGCATYEAGDTLGITQESAFGANYMFVRSDK